LAVDEALSVLVARTAAVLATAQHGVALTGAGISTESGIPDFRGPSGIWTRDPAAERRAYQGYQNFLEDPGAWWRERLSSSGPGLGNLWDMKPNPGHVALVDLERDGVLKCIITQNIDALHVKAGSSRVIEYHGSFMKIRCVSCGARYFLEEYDLEQLCREDRLPPRCRGCGGIVKSDTVSFGEPIPSDVARNSVDEIEKCDVMLVCGTSAVVYPFASLPVMAPQRAGVTIVEINAEPTSLTTNGISDYLIQGRTGVILPAIVEEVRRIRSTS
jgi:NAD-dependent deacetylase